MPSLQINITKEQQKKLREIAENKKTIIKYVGEEMVAEYIKKHGGKK